MTSKIKTESCDSKKKGTENYQKLKDLSKKYNILKIEHHELVDEKIRCKRKIQEQDEKIKTLQHQLKYPEYIEPIDVEED